jgi:hypothetical protein
MRRNARKTKNQRARKEVMMTTYFKLRKKQRNPFLKVMICWMKKKKELLLMLMRVDLK